MQSNVKGQIYHVEINVSNFDKSGEFYDGFLGWLGYKKIGYWKTGGGWGIEGCNVWVFQSGEKFVKDGYHRKRVGVEPHRLPR
jgi:catechol 2,3-dioxygenase-like lactoylglutathione lyase family enzyme